MKNLKIVTLGYEAYIPQEAGIVIGVGLQTRVTITGLLKCIPK
jgi:hypothetical protein